MCEALDILNCISSLGSAGDFQLKFSWQLGKFSRVLSSPFSPKSVVNVLVLVLRVNDKLLFGWRDLLRLSVGKKFGKCRADALQFYVPLRVDREGKTDYLQRGRVGFCAKTNNMNE